MLLPVSATIGLVQTTDHYSRLNQLRKLHPHPKHTETLEKIKLKRFSATMPSLKTGETSSGTRSKEEIQNASSERASKPREPQESGARHMLEARREAKGGRRDPKPKHRGELDGDLCMKPAAKTFCLVYKPRPNKLMPVIQECGLDVGCWEIRTLRLLCAEVWGSNVYCQRNTEIQVEILTLKVAPSSSRTSALQKQPMRKELVITVNS